MRLSFSGRLAIVLATINAQAAWALPQTSTTTTGLGTSPIAGSNASLGPTVNINGTVTKTLNATAWSLIVGITDQVLSCCLTRDTS